MTSRLPPQSSMQQTGPGTVADPETGSYVALRSHQCLPLFSPVNGQVPSMIRQNTIEFCVNVCLDDGTRTLVGKGVTKLWVPTQQLPPGVRTAVPHPYVAPNGNIIWTDSEAFETMNDALSRIFNPPFNVGLARTC